MRQTQLPESNLTISPVTGGKTAIYSFQQPAVYKMLKTQIIGKNEVI
jgi:hypothetical protein